MEHVFPIVPASARGIWVLAPIGAFLIAMLIFFGYIALSSRHVRFEVSSKGLRIAGDLYGRTIPFDVLEANGARAIDLTLETDYALRLRTNGVGLPGYQSGWFRLANGEKALVFLTDRHRVVRIPTSKGYSVLVSVVDPDVFLSTLRGAAPR